MENYVDQVIAYLKTLFSVKAEQNLIAVNTPLLYPNGDLIVVGIQVSGQFLTLTDVGETAMYLEDYGFAITQSETRQKIFETLYQQNAMHFEDGELWKVIHATADEIGRGIWDFALTIMLIIHTISILNQ